MTTRSRTAHVVVDGSNIATEGRSAPSLAQLNEAVLAYLEEHPGTTVTVVVDATFGHRISKAEIREFDAAVANNEIVAPPAGAIGRGDAFVLSVANKANATVLSNDSFQEFHGTYDWLFEDGRLIGGKPVPHVGWVFVPRSPVRGPVSRKAVRALKTTAVAASSRSRRGAKVAELTENSSTKRAGRPSKEASQPMPVPTSPPPGRALATADTVNELMPFLDFVEHHPVGTSVNAVVDSYSSHGAYVRIGDVLGYVPIRLMADPPPRSAREVMKVGDAVTLVVTSFAPGRRSIDCAVPHMATGTVEPATDVVETALIEALGQPAEEVPAAITDDTGAPAKRTRRKVPAKQRATTRAAAGEAAGVDAAGVEPIVETVLAPVPDDSGPAEPAPGKKAAARKAAAKKAAAKKATAKKATARKAAARKRSVDETAAAPPEAPSAGVEPAPRKRAAKRTAAAEPAASKSAGDTQPAPVTRTATKRSAAKRSGETAAARSGDTETPAKRGTGKRSAAEGTAKRRATDRAAAAKRTAEPSEPADTAGSADVTPAHGASTRRGRRRSSPPAGEG